MNSENSRGCEKAPACSSPGTERAGATQSSAGAFLLCCTADSQLALDPQPHPRGKQ